MTRLLRGHPPIDVEMDAAGALVAIRWNGRRERVEERYALDVVAPRLASILASSR